MNPAAALRQFGATQQKLLRQLLLMPQGASVEELCQTLGVTHNAVRQHLTGLIAAGWVARGDARPSGGRPRACYVLLPAGRELFPRNYGVIAHGMLEHLYTTTGTAGVQSMLVEMGRRLGAAAARRIDAANPDQDVAGALAEQLDALGYEAQAVRHGGELQVEARNCVFHALAKAHPDVCRFDLAFMEAATGRPIEHRECMLRGGRVCRFRIGTPENPTAGDAG